jgi:two-component system nitrogen regulation sensor histidine kinase NtrY
MEHDLKSAYQRIYEKRRKRRDTIIILVVGALLIVLVYYMRRMTGITSAIPLTSNILIFGLINLNIILLCLLVFFLIRNITKFLLERRQRFTVSSLRTKLVLILTGFSLLPAVIFFSIATSFITKSINNWFSEQIELSLRNAKEVVDDYYNNMGLIALRFVKGINNEIRDRDLFNSPQQLKSFLKRRIELSGVSVIEVFDDKGKEIASLINNKNEYGGMIPGSSDVIANAYKGKDDVHVLTLESGDIIWAVSPLRDASGNIKGVTAVNNFIPRSLVVKKTALIQSYDDFKTNELMKETVKGTFILFLLVITLLVIFSASWLGVQVANSITGPINEVAEAASRIAKGELDIYISAPQEQELRNLVGAFNRMVRDLKNNREQLRSAYQSLSDTNIELEQRRKYMEAVLQNVASGVISLDSEGRITTINRSAERILNLKREDVLGKKYKEVLGPNHMKIVKDLIQTVNRLSKDSVELEEDFADGREIRKLLTNLTVLRDESNNYLGVVVVFEDITELVRVQKLSAWREIARRIAHEIKNPLTPIQLSAQRLKRKYAPGIKEDIETFTECVDTITRQADVLKSMVDEFSSFSRFPVASPSMNDLNLIVNEVMALYRTAQKDIKFEVILDKNLPMFEFDRNQLNRLIINLLENAISAVNGKGTITIRTLHDAAENAAVLEVSDDGQGIPPEIKPRLFEPYFSTKKGGMGLGLAIVHSIVKEHSGKILVEDNLPKGARFIIKFPYLTASVSQKLLKSGAV